MCLLSVVVPKTPNALAFGESESRGIFHSDEGGALVPKSQSPLRPSEPRASLGCPSVSLIRVPPLEAAQRGLLQDTLSESRLSSASQGERKGVNKYYPPDFNPEKVRAGSLPRVHASKKTPQSRGRRARHPLPESESLFPGIDVAVASVTFYSGPSLACFQRRSGGGPAHRLRVRPSCPPSSSSSGFPSVPSAVPSTWNLLLLTTGSFPPFRSLPTAGLPDHHSFSVTSPSALFLFVALMTP